MYTVTLPWQGDGKPASAFFPGNTILLSSLKPKLNCSSIYREDFSHHWNHIQLWFRVPQIVAALLLRTAFDSHHKLSKLLSSGKKPPESVFDTKNVIYSVPCEFGCEEYVGESCLPLHFRLNENKNCSIRQYDEVRTG